MNSYPVIFAVVAIACFSFIIAGCTGTGDSGGTPAGSGQNGTLYIIDQNDLEGISLFGGEGSLVEFFSPAVLEKMNIPEETDISIGYVVIPPGNGTPLHYLLGSDEVIYVISGGGVITIDGQECELSSGRAVLIPAGSVQSFMNAGDTNLVYLTIVQPYYKYENDIPVDGDAGNISYKSHPEIFISNPEENEEWNPSDGVNIHAVVNRGVMTLPADAVSTEYSIAIAEFSPGASIPPEVLTGSDELDYVLEGEIEVSSGDNKYTVRKGQAVLIPKGVSREFRNNDNDKTVLLSLVNPYWRDETGSS
ncbi:cupin domain-containing protein [Methanolacinia paynteri]|uniref:cupin domain-containing protein n=1 Tax=Methanolacinia paynteri TaxID=230356 RepID=UPI000693443F|nr:cupin domain-containing protein [Methanolacinia paynteri]